MAVFQQDQMARIGVRFMLSGSPYSLVGASTKQIILKDPDGDIKTEDAEFLTDGSDGIIYYDAEVGYLADYGVWEIQGYAVTPSWTGHTRTGSFQVKRNIID